MHAIVDADKYPGLMKFKWRAVKAKVNWYAKTTIEGKHGRVTICMHRMIARTPFGMVTHHVNLNSLDNRFCNLVNMEKQMHTLHHSNNKFRVKFSGNAEAIGTDRRD